MSPVDQLFGFWLAESEAGSIVYIRFDDSACEDVFGCPGCSTPQRLVELTDKRATGTYQCAVCAQSFPIWINEEAWR